MSSERTHRDGTGCFHVPILFQERFYGDFDPGVGPAAAAGLEAIRRVVSGDLRGLLLSGPVGCGKSLLAAIACNELGAPLMEILWNALHRLWEAEDMELSKERSRLVAAANKKVASEEEYFDSRCPRWIAVPTTLGAMRREMTQEKRPATETYREALDAGGLLVLDDIGAEKATDWTLSTLFELVGRHYDDHLQVIVTSNLTARELVAAGYGRIVSRIADEGALIEMKSAGDYRMRRRKTLADEL